MWEDATPKSAPDTPVEGPAPSRGKGTQPTGNYILWAQVLLVVLALGIVFAVQRLQLPAGETLRRTFEQAMALEGLEAFQGERSLVRFIQTGARALEDAAANAAVRLVDGVATGESARPAHGKTGSEVPAGASADLYQPPFSLAQPLPAGFTRTSGFGWRQDPLTTRQTEDFHLGLDLAAAEGTPVYAAADGTVRWSGLGQSYGNYLRILHSGGDETLYAHMQYIFVHPGQQVRQGQVIGTVGQTGDVTGPHLHFELLHDGIRHDPAAALGLA